MLEFVVTNTLEDVQLDNITVKLSGVEETGLFQEIGELGIATLAYGDVIIPPITTTVAVVVLLLLLRADQPM